MEEFELKSIWQAYDMKLAKSLKLNLRIFEEMQTGKARSKLNSLSMIKWAGIILGISWNIFLGVLICSDHLRNMYFTVSVGAIVLFGIIAIGTYIKHLYMINQINYTQNVTDAQAKLAELQVSTIRITAFSWLHLPFYTTFFWNNNLVMNGGLNFWLAAFPVTLLFTVVAIWLYKNITPKNLSKMWVKKILAAGVEYSYLVAANELLQEIEEFKKDEL